MPAYFRRVEETGEDLIVMSDGKPTLKVSRYVEKKTVSEVFGDIRGKALLPEHEVLSPESESW